MGRWGPGGSIDLPKMLGVGCLLRQGLAMKFISVTKQGWGIPKLVSLSVRVALYASVFLVQGVSVWFKANRSYTSTV